MNIIPPNKVYSRVYSYDFLYKSVDLPQPFQRLKNAPLKK